MSRNSYPTPSPQARGRVNAERLAKWVEETPILEVPLNQFGRVARERVCKMLQIAPSTVRTNENIKRHFDELDGRLTEVARPERLRQPSSRRHSNSICRRQRAFELSKQRSRDFSILKTTASSSATLNREVDYPDRYGLTHNPCRCKWRSNLRVLAVPPDAIRKSGRRMACLS